MVQACLEDSEGSRETRAAGVQGVGGRAIGDQVQVMSGYMIRVI